MIVPQKLRTSLWLSSIPEGVVSLRLPGETWGHTYIPRARKLRNVVWADAVESVQ